MAVLDTDPSTLLVTTRMRYKALFANSFLKLSKSSAVVMALFPLSKAATVASPSAVRFRTYLLRVEYLPDMKCCNSMMLSWDDEEETMPASADTRR